MLGLQFGLGGTRAALGPAIPSDPVTLFAANPSLNKDDTNASTTFWTVGKLNSQTPLDEIRFTIEPAGINTLTILGLGFAKFVAEGTALGTITEATFAEASGFASKTTAQVSDWINIRPLGFSAGDYIAIGFTTGIAGQASNRYNDLAYVADTYFKAGTSWNDPAAAMSGYTKLAGRNYAIAKIETRSLRGGGGTPPAENTIPMSFNDQMFSAMTEYVAPIALSDGVNLSRMSIETASGDPAINCTGTNTVSYCRVLAREGSRATAHQTFNKCYIEAQGLSGVGDHADTLQVFSEGQVGGALVVTNSHLRGYNIDATANFFCSDDWSGALNFENVILQGGPYGVRIDSDPGCHIDISLANVYFVGPFGTATHLIQDVGNGSHEILQWDNVMEATIVNGAIVPGNAIANPTPLPEGFNFLKGADGAYLKGADGAYLYGAA